MSIQPYEFYKTQYADGTLALLFRNTSDPDSPEYYNKVTVNLGVKLPENCVYLDANHLPVKVQSELKRYYNLIELTQSGFVEYPLVQFSPVFINSLTTL